MATVTKNFGNCNPGWQTPANWERDLDDQGFVVQVSLQLLDRQ